MKTTERLLSASKVIWEALHPGLPLSGGICQDIRPWDRESQEPGNHSAVFQVCDSADRRGNGYPPGLYGKV